MKWPWIKTSAVFLANYIHVSFTYDYNNPNNHFAYICKVSANSHLYPAITASIPDVEHIHRFYTFKPLHGLYVCSSTHNVFSSGLYVVYRLILCEWCAILLPCWDVWVIHRVIILIMFRILPTGILLPTGIHIIHRSYMSGGDIWYRRE